MDSLTADEATPRPMCVWSQLHPTRLPVCRGHERHQRGIWGCPGLSNDVRNSGQFIQGNSNNLINNVGKLLEDLKIDRSILLEFISLNDLECWRLNHVEVSTFLSFHHLNDSHEERKIVCYRTWDYFDSTITFYKVFLTVYIMYIFIIVNSFLIVS